jgi:hypothetical protein
LVPRIVAALFLIWTVAGAAFAVPATYTFSTGPLRLSTDLFNPSSITFNLNSLHTITSAERAVTQSLNAMLVGTSLTGSFLYDSAIPRTSMTSGGSLGSLGANYVGSFTFLSADIIGGTLSGGERSITDPRGQTVVGNQASMGFQDYLQLQAEPGNGSNPGLLNIQSTFTLGDYEVFNFRMFWLQGQAVPEVIPDFLSSNNLPNPLPSINGRLGIDFVNSSDPFGTQHIMFYDNLRVAALPEPAILALVGAGLTGFGFSRRRRISS